MIEVSNGYINGWTCGHYIGRQRKVAVGSALANPYRLHNPSNEAERDRIIIEYRRWLWQKMQARDSAVMHELMLLLAMAIVGNVRLLCLA